MEGCAATSLLREGAFMGLRRQLPQRGSLYGEPTAANPLAFSVYLQQFHGFFEKKLFKPGLSCYNIAVAQLR